MAAVRLRPGPRRLSAGATRSTRRRRNCRFSATCSRISASRSSLDSAARKVYGSLDRACVSARAAAARPPPVPARSTPATRCTPTIITRRGKAEAVGVDIGEYRRLRRLRRLAEQSEDRSAPRVRPVMLGGYCQAAPADTPSADGATSSPSRSAVDAHPARQGLREQNLPGSQSPGFVPSASVICWRCLQAVRRSPWCCLRHSSGRRAVAAARVPRR